MAPAEEWSRIIIDVQQDVGRLVADITSRKPRSLLFATTAWQPAIDCYETEDSIVVLVELAGVKPEETRLSVSSRVLKISGVRRETKKTRRIYHLMEIGWGPFERQIELPAAVDYARAQADCEEGFLEIVLPKTAPPRQLNIR